MTTWFDALKTWNESREGKWKIPKKGTSEHAEVKALMTKMKKGGTIKKKKSKKKSKKKVKILV